MIKITNTSNEFEKRKPDYRGNGVVVWLNKTKEGIEFLNIKILNSIIVKAYREKKENDEPLKVTHQDVK